MAVVNCPCAFRLRRLSSVCFHVCVRLRFPICAPVCSHMSALLCVLSTVCSSTYAPMRMFPSVCFHMRALIMCALIRVCVLLCALTSVPSCVLVCALMCECVLSFVCSHDNMFFSYFHPPHGASCRDNEVSVRTSFLQPVLCLVSLVQTTCDGGLKEVRGPIQHGPTKLGCDYRTMQPSKDA